MVKPQHLAALEAVRNGMAISRAAPEHNMTVRKLIELCREQGVKSTASKGGSRNEDTARARELWTTTGLDHQTIATRLGVSRTAVERWTKGLERGKAPIVSDLARGSRAAYYMVGR